MRTYTTGDSDEWPDYDLPVVIEIEVPEVPEGLSEPAEPSPQGQG